eukprot:10980014-Alexandrium_andersonii.AAC.1
MDCAQSVARWPSPSCTCRPTVASHIGSRHRVLAPGNRLSSKLAHWQSPSCARKHGRRVVCALATEHAPAWSPTRDAECGARCALAKSILRNAAQG